MSKIAGIEFTKKTQIEILQRQYKELQIKYKNLNTRFNELKKEYNGDVGIAKENGNIRLYSEPDKDILNKYANGTRFICKPTNVGVRIWKQLAKYKIVCKYIANHFSEDENWNTAIKVEENTKIACKFVDYYIYYTNAVTGKQTLNIKTSSLSYKDCSQEKANAYINDAFEFLAGKIGVTAEELVKNATY